MEKKSLNERELNNVSGGMDMPICTEMNMGAVIRSGPGSDYSEVTFLSDGVHVNTTGNISRSSDGIDWYEISSPVCGWIKGNTIGL